ncbi:MAG: efflux transporter outer membrane subunit [Calditrichaeota bacterium]|nr:MAG: efflux transporter outer membrane subunit [Calditrichota bacterium]
MNYKSMILAMVTVALTGCAPTVRHPALRDAPPEQWTAGDSIGITMEADSVWWQAFHDPALDSLLREALDYNYSLKGALARLEAAAAQRTMTGAGLFPSLNLSASGSRRKQNFIGLPIPGPKKDILTSYANTFGVTANVSWEIDLWGRTSAARGAADAEWQATMADYLGARLSVTAQTAKAWYAVVEARQQVELARKNWQRARAAQESVWRRYKNGLRPSLDFRLARTETANAETMLTQRRQQLESAQRQLEILLGHYPSGRIATRGMLPEINDAIPRMMPATLLTRRPDIIAAERRLAKARANVWSARAALFPSISLSASYGTSANKIEDMFNTDLSVWNLAANVLQPVFNGGRLLAGIDLAKAAQKQAFVAYAQTALTAYGEVETLMANEGHLKKQMESAAVAMHEAEAARALARERYDKGLADIITLLNARKNAYNAHSQWLNLHRQRIYNRIDLYMALGGGIQNNVNASTAAVSETFRHSSLAAHMKREK